MKNTQLINQLAVSVGKISYLFKSIRKSNAETNQLEVALLKRYAVELYDQVLLLEKTTSSKTDTSESSKSYIETKVSEQLESIKNVAPVLSEGSVEMVSFEDKETGGGFLENIDTSTEAVKDHLDLHSVVNNATSVVEEQKAELTETVEDATSIIEEQKAELAETVEDATSIIEEQKAELAETVEDATSIIEEQKAELAETVEDATSIVKDTKEDILEIKSVPKEEVIEQIILEANPHVKIEEDYDATSLMEMDKDFFSGKPEVELNKDTVPEPIAEYEEDNHDATIVFERPSENISENIPIAEKLQRTLARLQEQEEEVGKTMNPTKEEIFEDHSEPEDDATIVLNPISKENFPTHEEEEDDATMIFNHNPTADVGIEDDATMVINHTQKESFMDDSDLPEGATRIISPIRKELFNDEPESEEIELPVQPVLTDDNSVRTQVFEDIKRSQEVEEENLDVVMDNGGDETVALELNDVLARSSGGNSGGSHRKMDISFNQRFAFINQLFKGDSNSYNKALEGISTSEGYIQALTYVNLNLVHDYGWDSNDPVVKDFKEVIRKCFLD
ncbi:MAG: hypothetical protein AB8B69_16380 [Chitinophagales bacterium]